MLEEAGVHREIQANVVSANGGEPVAITPEAGSFASLAWSPDSTKLAFLGQDDASKGFGKNTRMWTVGADGLRCDHEAINTSGTAVPWGYSVHPYLQLTGVAVDVSVLSLASIGFLPAAPPRPFITPPRPPAFFSTPPIASSAYSIAVGLALVAVHLDPLGRAGAGHG